MHTFLDPREATKVLPLISSIMKDVIDAHKTLEQVLTKYELEHDLEEASVIIDESVDKAIAHLQSYVNEVEKYGGFVRDTKEGIVDFTGSINNEAVWLCWKIGEPEVIHYHKLHSSCDCRECITNMHTV